MMPGRNDRQVAHMMADQSDLSEPLNYESPMAMVKFSELLI